MAALAMCSVLALVSVAGLAGGASTPLHDGIWASGSYDDYAPLQPATVALVSSPTQNNTLSPDAASQAEHDDERYKRYVSGFEYSIINSDEAAPHAPELVGLLSFPNSGNTWLRNLLEAATGVATECIAEYNEGGVATPEGTQVKGNGQSQRDDVHRAGPMQPRIVKSHHAHDTAKFPRVLRLVRDIVGNAHTTYAFTQQNYPRLLNDVEYDQYLLDTTLDCLAWHCAVNQAVTEGATVLTLRYEDLVEDPAKHLRRVIDFAGFDNVRDSDIQKAVDAYPVVEHEPFRLSAAISNATLRSQLLDELEQAGKAGFGEGCATQMKGVWSNIIRMYHNWTNASSAATQLLSGRAEEGGPPADVQGDAARAEARPNSLGQAGLPDVPATRPWQQDAAQAQALQGYTGQTRDVSDMGGAAQNDTDGQPPTPGHSVSASEQTVDSNVSQSTSLNRSDVAGGDPDSQEDSPQTDNGTENAVPDWSMQQNRSTPSPVSAKAMHLLLAAADQATATVPSSIPTDSPAGKQGLTRLEGSDGASAVSGHPTDSRGRPVDPLGTRKQPKTVDWGLTPHEEQEDEGFGLASQQLREAVTQAAEALESQQQQAIKGADHAAKGQTTSQPILTTKEAEAAGARAGAIAAAEVARRIATSAGAVAGAQAATDAAKTAGAEAGAKAGAYTGANAGAKTGRAAGMEAGVAAGVAAGTNAGAATRVAESGQLGRSPSMSIDERGRLTQRRADEADLGPEGPEANRPLLRGVTAQLLNANTAQYTSEAAALADSSEAAELIAAANAANLSKAQLKELIHGITAPAAPQPAENPDALSELLKRLESGASAASSPTSPTPDPLSELLKGIRAGAPAAPKPVAIVLKLLTRTGRLKQFGSFRLNLMASTIAAAIEGLDPGSVTVTASEVQPAGVKLLAHVTVPPSKSDEVRHALLTAYPTALKASTELGAAFVDDPVVTDETTEASTVGNTERADSANEEADAATAQAAAAQAEARAKVAEAEAAQAAAAQAIAEANAAKAKAAATAHSAASTDSATRASLSDGER